MTFAREHVHSLPFKPGRRERALGVHCQERVKEDIFAIWNKCQTPYAFTVAYKSGTLERNALKELRIRYIDLEHYGCPTFEQLKC